MKDWWIEYIDGTRKIFQAPDRVAAHHYFMMEGDHAYDYGLVEPIIEQNYSASTD